MDIINNIFPQLTQFVMSKNVDLIFVVKLMDYLFNELDLNVKNDAEVTSYVHNIKIVNNLYSLLSLTTHYEPTELNAFNNEAIQTLIDEPNRIPKFKEFRLKTLQKHNADLMPMFKEFRQGKF